MALHLVTGSSGFLGSRIVKKLLEINEEVIAIDIIDDFENSKICEFHKLDISNKESLINLFKKVEHVHHNAALVPLTKSGKKFYQSNVIGTKNIVDLSLKNEISHISHMSSSAIFGKPKKNEDNVDYHTYNPTSTYGHSKYLAELEIINNFSKNKKKHQSFSVIRPRPVLGKGRLGIFEILFDWVKVNKKIPIIGKGNNIFQFAHVDDLVEVSIETALRKKGGIFNIGTNKYGTLKNDLNAFFQKVGSKSKVLPLNKKICENTLWILDKLNLSPLSSWHYLSYSWNFYYDLTKEFEVLDWRPKYSNIDMLAESYNYYLENMKNLDHKSIHQRPLKQKLLNFIKFFC